MNIPKTIGDLCCPAYWLAPIWKLCTYCATPGREDRPLDAPDVPDGHCLGCGDELEPIDCVDGQPCDEPHDNCPDCDFAAGPCHIDHSEAKRLDGADFDCVFCHGTGRIRTDHCCSCRQKDSSCDCPDPDYVSPAWDTRCECGHFAIRHGSTDTGDIEGPCRWCDCKGFVEERVERCVDCEKCHGCQSQGGAA